MDMTYIKELADCKCGREHLSDGKIIITGKGALGRLPEALEGLGTRKAFLLADANTYPIAGERIKALCAEIGILCTEYIFADKALEPDERAVGSAVMHFDKSCDTVIALGSGVLNDIGKIVSNVSGAKYVIVGTAPSMDGYASATSSMSMDGLKVSLPSKSADVIIGDTDILKTAPLHMLRAGLGDMIAKYISICEWRIANIITGEYYCESIASLVRAALKKCVDNADKLLDRDEEAIEAVFEGLVFCGDAMRLAGVSRPASGVEHYLSHVWDMRGEEFGTKVDLHGIQCAVGTIIALRIYEKIKSLTPDRNKALRYASGFDFKEWSDKLRAFLGKGAQVMIAQETADGKYDPVKHEKRLDVIIENWEKLLKIMNEELPSV